MKKTLTANISGTVFHIEEDAYDKLQRYLGTIRGQFAGTEGRDEIMADIEARIAELFQERLDGKRQVVSLTDVDHVIGVMGQPEDYLGEEGPTFSAEEQAAFSSTNGRGRKRLMRDTDDRWVGGVLSGIANYFGFDPLILRVVYIALLFLGIGWLIYIILWIVVPPATTAAEKLAMRGEAVNVENLKRVFHEGSERFKAGAERVAEEVDQRWNGPAGRTRQEQFRKGAARGMSSAASVLGKLIGIALLFIGTALGMGLIGMIAGGGSLAYDSLVGGNGMGYHELGGLVFTESSQAIWFFSAAVLLALIPVLGLILAGVRLLFGVRSPGWFSGGMAILWGAALVVTIIIGTRLGNDFKRSEALRTEHTLEQPTGQVLYLDELAGSGLAKNWNLSYDDGRVEWDGDGFAASVDSLHGAWAELDVMRSPDTDFHLVVERKAQARNAKASLVRASHITYTVQQEDSVLRFSPWLDFPKSDKIRAQRVRFILQVPVGKAVHFGHAMGHMLDDVKNVTNTYDDDMGGRTWTMTPRGLDGDIHPNEVPDAPTPNVTDSTTVVVHRATPDTPEPAHGALAATRSTITTEHAADHVMPDLLGLLFYRI